MINRENFGEASLAARLRRGEYVTGVFITEFETPNWGPLLDAVNYDFGIIDLEHGLFTLSSLARMLPGFHGCRSSALIRVPSTERSFFQAPLDLGAAGIILPMVESAEEARRAVALMKYPPLGRRGIGFGRPHTDFLTNPDRDDYIAHANASTLLIVQIETAAGVEQAEEILAVPGIDVVFIGNADLSQSLGCRNDFRAEPLKSAVAKIFQAAARNKLIVGGNLTDAGLVRDFAPHNFRFITLTTDVDMIEDGFNGKWTPELKAAMLR